MIIRFIVFQRVLNKDPSGPRIRSLAIIDRSLRSEDVVLYFRCLGASTARELPIAHVFECLARGGNPLRGIQTSSSSLKILKWQGHPITFAILRRLLLFLYPLRGSPMWP